MQGVFGQRRAAVSARTAAFSIEKSLKIKPDTRALGGRRAASTTLGALAFLATYMAVHASFITRCTPRLIINLSSVPLFATALASAVAAAPITLLGFMLIEAGLTLLPRLKLPLAVVTLLFALEMLLAP